MYSYRATVLQLKSLLCLSQWRRRIFRSTKHSVRGTANTPQLHHLKHIAIRRSTASGKEWYYTPDEDQTKNLRRIRGWPTFTPFVKADEITVSAPNERVDLEALKATKARRKGAER